MASDKRKIENQIRIIGGKLKRSKLQFPPALDLRPTPDRIRETVFNWLQNDIYDARCLDLFAGSGALGLESVSRGAAYVVMVEKDTAAANSIVKNLHRLKISNAEVRAQDVMNFLLTNISAESFDIVFLDPPYRSDLLTESIKLLEQQNWLQPQAKIYIETSSDCEIDLPANWYLFKKNKSGQVGYHLAIRKN